MRPAAARRGHGEVARRVRVAGNPPLRVTEAPGGGMLNSVGLPGPGVDAWIADDLPALEAHGARVIASIWGRTVDEYETAAARARSESPTGLVAVEVNLSCPNVEARGARVRARAGRRRATRRTRSSTRSAARRRCSRSCRRTSPTSCEIAGAALDAGATGLTLVNTVMGLVGRRRRPARRELGAGGGGLSGPPIKPIALRAVWEVSRAFPACRSSAPAVCASGEDAVEMLLAGARRGRCRHRDFADPRATLRIVDELRTWCARTASTRVRDLIGGLR